MARVELLKIRAYAVTLHRDEAGKITEERPGPELEFHTLEELATFYERAVAECAAASAELEPNRETRRRRRRPRVKRRKPATA